MDVRYAGVGDVQALARVLERDFSRAPEIRWFTVTFPVPSVPQSIYHEFGRKPFGWIANGYGTDPDLSTLPGQVYATVRDRRQWDERRIVLRVEQIIVEGPSRFEIGIIFQ